MLRHLAFTFALIAAFAQSAFAQSSPGVVFGQVPTATQWNSYFAAKQDLLVATGNSLLSNVTSGAAYPTFEVMPSCSAANQALIWTTNVGFGCQTLPTGGGSPAGAANAIQINGGSGSFAAVTPANSSVLVTNGSGVPSLSTSLPNITVGSGSTNGITLSGSSTNPVLGTTGGSLYLIPASGTNVQINALAMDLVGSSPNWISVDSSQGTDLKSWKVSQLLNGTYSIVALNDAQSAQTTAYQISRGTGSNAYGIPSHTWYTSTASGTPIQRMFLNSSGLQLSPLAGATDIGNLQVARTFSGTSSSGFVNSAIYASDTVSGSPVGNEWAESVVLNSSATSGQHVGIAAKATATGTATVWGMYSQFYGQASGGTVIGEEIQGGRNITGNAVGLDITQPTGYTIDEAIRTPTGTNISIGANGGSYGGGLGVIYIANDNTDPTANPTGGGVLYSSGGVLKWRGQTGAATNISALPGYITGCMASNDATTPNSVLDISGCVATDSANAMTLNGAAITKSTAGAWAAGTGHNGMGSGLTVAASTWYHVCAAVISGAYDVFFDTAVACTHTPTGTTATRRIGSIKTDASSNIIGFVQYGQTNYWTTQVTDASSVATFTAPTLVALTVPPGLSVFPIVSIRTSIGASMWSGLYSTATNNVGANGTPVFDQFATNTASQIYFSFASTGSSFTAYTYGWRDTTLAEHP